MMTAAQEFMEEARMEGRMEGQINALVTLMQTKFGHLSEGQLKQIESADPATLSQRLVRVLTADSVDEVLR